MTPDDAQEYTESLGQIVAGSWRQIALAKRLGVPKALGLSTREWVDDRLGGYVKLDIADRKQAVAELLEEGHSQRQAAEILGVDEGTVRNDQRAEHSAPAPTRPAETDLPSAEDSAPESTPGVLGMVATFVAEEIRRQGTPDAPGAHVSHNSGQNEWYTPDGIIEAARQLMGGINVDPASSEAAQRTVRADTYFSADDDGLAHDWPGSVWMNPPYAQPLISQFVARLLEQLDAHTTEQAVTLTNNGTETGWGSGLLARASAVCFPTGRIRFLDPDGNPGGAPLQGQMITYHGPRVAEFLALFNTWGPVKVRV